MQSRVFKWKYSNRAVYHYITVTSGGVVKYTRSIITVVQNGKVLYKFRNVCLLQVYNRIEGHLRFYGQASKQERTFPGHGKPQY